jgi:hypothetical protein
MEGLLSKRRKGRFLPVLAMMREGLHIKKLVVLRDEQKGMNLLRGEERDRSVLCDPKFVLCKTISFQVCPLGTAGYLHKIVGLMHRRIEIF